MADARRVQVHADDALIPGSYITKEGMQAVLDRQSHLCAGCNAPLGAGSTHFDLRQPAIYGGSHTLGNFEALCPFCHQNRMRQLREWLTGHRTK